MIEGLYPDQREGRWQEIAPSPPVNEAAVVYVLAVVGPCTNTGGGGEQTTIAPVDVVVVWQFRPTSAPSEPLLFCKLKSLSGQPV